MPNNKILFVDDDMNILKSVERLFNESGLDIITVSSGTEALKVLINERVSVIVSDNFMPGMKGIDLLTKIRVIYPDIVRIMMTGNADLDTAIDAINRGEVFRFITKPWDDDLLIETVREGIKRYQIIKDLKSADESTLLSLAQTIELKDKYTRGHCDRVAGYAVNIARHLGFDEELINNIKFGSWLHDCGKIGVPEAILNKPGSLTDEEMDIIKKHPLWGTDVARQAQLEEPVINIILYHHEKYGGNGYPTGISATDIPIEARIAAIADCFDAITSDRSYREGSSIDKGKKIILSMKGSHLDPELVDLFISILDEKMPASVLDERKVSING